MTIPKRCLKQNQIERPSSPGLTITACNLLSALPVEPGKRSLRSSLGQSKAMSALRSAAVHARRCISSSTASKSTPGGAAGLTKEWLEPYLHAPQAGASLRSEHPLSARQRRIIFRSRQRGWLELDVLLGSWAAKHVPGLTEERDIVMVETLLALETPHLYKWIIGQEQPPAEVDNQVMKSLQAFARGGSNLASAR
jgi:succinate dehydrogenase flavin-adding protein (antitoxin of CptAB toxin-antitoxin module)